LLTSSQQSSARAAPTTSTIVFIAEADRQRQDPYRSGAGDDEARGAEERQMRTQAPWPTDCRKRGHEWL
jgi:hypothetical protein